MLLYARFVHVTRVTAADSAGNVLYDFPVLIRLPGEKLAVPSTKSAKRTARVTQNKPKSSKKFDLADINFTLVSDEKTLADIDRAQAEAIQAA